MKRHTVILISTLLFLIVPAIAGDKQPAKTVLDGNDPVLLTQGTTEKGSDTHALEHEGYRYLFASQANLDTFKKTPATYQIQMQGACARMAKEGAPAGSGKPHLYTVHEQKLYLFGSPECVEVFKANPAEFLPQK